jgi:hypothetical protein
MKTIPLTPAQYNGFGLREMSVYKSRGGPASSMYSGSKIRMIATRSMNSQNFLESRGLRQAEEIINAPLQ